MSNNPERAFCNSICEFNCFPSSNSPSSPACFLTSSRLVSYLAQGFDIFQSGILTGATENIRYGLTDFVRKKPEAHSIGQTLFHYLERGCTSPSCNDFCTSSDEMPIPSMLLPWPLSFHVNVYLLPLWYPLPLSEKIPCLLAFCRNGHKFLRADTGFLKYAGYSFRVSRNHRLHLHRPQNHPYNIHGLLRRDAKLL